MLQGNMVDDRPMNGVSFELAELNSQAAAILELHKGKQPHHYTIKDNK
jgi:hypothetical protein